MLSSFDNLNRNFWLKTTPYLVILTLELLLDVSDCMTQAEINRHLELGKQYLASGQLGDALSQYHLAVEGDPNNYLTYFKRGTVYLALGKAKNALSDLDRVLELKPDFTAARISRGNVHLKQANYDLAQLDYYNVLKSDPYNAEANELILRIDPTKEKKRSAEYYYGRDDYVSAIHYLTEVMEVSPWASDLYEFRSELHMLNGDEVAAISDIRSATKLQSDNTDGFFKLSKLLYKAGQATEALKAIRECLKLDPEHKDCFPFYKKIKKVEKFLTDAESSLENKEYAQCIESANKALKNEKDVASIIYEAKRLLCACYSRDEQDSEAITFCTEALAYNDDPNIYCDRAEAYLNQELYDDAIRDYRSALEVDSHFERAKEGLNKAENRQKQAEKRDYYKILEVKRTASKKEIVKAYRKMAQKWHPDNYQLDEKMKKIAEKKFIDIAAAKEVLTDEEKRRQFDNGEDPLDPESGKSHMPNFHHFQSFHGSPFQFKFHFN
ncbi:dnaJ homolog subfamily C member 3 [Diabrotica virgifera virgifera]|uniref:J domain-containing protein n=1 Tax=Diabrotica virgifera virgifera TaxID=50390 RepID=A0ABM5IG76_DIAVI|nr:dnaJ homolog subfamily C member 3 [Diabrotica virgifera virgifera]